MFRNCHRTMSLVLCMAAMLAAAALLPRAARAAGTAQGTVISNQASASYQDAAANSFTATSGVVNVTVDPVYRVILTQPADQAASSNTTAYYAYTLTNTSNTSDTFNLSAISVPGWATAIYFDADGDGAFDAGEPVTATTGPLAADGTYRFLVAVTVPANTPNGTTSVTTLTAVGTGDPTAADDASDAVTTTAQAPALSVVKNVRNVTDGGVFGAAAAAAPGETLEYRLAVANGGATAASSINLSDAVSGNLGFVVGSAAFNAGTSGFPATAAEYSNDNGGTWAYVPVAGGCAPPLYAVAGVDYCVTNIRWQPAGSMPAGTDFNATFQAVVE